MARFSLKFKIVEPFVGESSVTKLASPSANDESRSHSILVSEASTGMRTCARGQDENSLMIIAILLHANAKF